MIKRHIVFIFLIVGNIVSAQLIFDFEDSNISDWLQYPGNNWKIITENDSNHMLWHSFDNESSGRASISILQSLDFSSVNTKWQFLVRHGYAPSASNHWAVVFSANQPLDLSSKIGLNGYAVGVNMTGSDDMLTLYRIENGDFDVLSKSSINWQEKVNILDFAAIVIDRSKSGDWSLKFNAEGNFDLVDEVASVFDITYLSGLFFGICYEYSSSQDLKLWIDDIYIDGEIITDDKAPTVVGYKFQSNKTLELQFSEAINPNCLIKTGFVLNAGANPDSIFLLSANKITLLFSEAFQTENTLSISNIYDYSGNILDNVNIDFYYYLPQLFDVLITEIMASPSPSNGLPEIEYIEIYNAAKYDINARNWQICMNEKCKKFDFELKKGRYKILCDIEDTAYFNDFGRTAGVESLYTLPNDGAELELKDDNNKLINYIKYSSSWHESAYKSEGGWSLEMIDLKNPCLQKENWSSSRNFRGGTPGIENSISGFVNDNTSPYLKRVSILNMNEIVVHFSKNIVEGYFLEKNNYSVEKHGCPDSIWKYSTGFDKIVLGYNEPFNCEERYVLKVSGEVADCSGNKIENNEAYFSFPLLPDSNDIVINEILFNSDNMGTEFIELYNRSDKTIDLNNIRIAMREAYSGELKNIVEIEEEGILFFPDSYFAITNNLENLKSKYTVKDRLTVFENKTPTMPDDDGTLVVCDYNLDIIDMVYYSDAFHHPLLENTEGVSIERIHPDNSSLKAESWHSASSYSGYATPGYQNSQSISEDTGEEMVQIIPEVFSPDNDGYDDVLEISLNAENENYLCHIKIFNSRGRPVRYLVNNELLGTRNSFFWNGLNDEGKLQPIGIYIILIKMFDIEGHSFEFKKTCVLATRLN